MNRFDEFREAVREAETTLRAADTTATHIARILVGRLRKVESVYVLEKLKRELRDFNMNTHQWKK